MRTHAIRPRRVHDFVSSIFDFALRSRLKGLCDGYGYDLRELAAPGALYRDRRSSEHKACPSTAEPVDGPAASSSSTHRPGAG